jgi:hypothetical protein
MMRCLMRHRAQLARPRQQGHQILLIKGSWYRVWKSGAQVPCVYAKMKGGRARLGNRDCLELVTSEESRKEHFLRFHKAKKETNNNEARETLYSCSHARHNTLDNHEAREID